MTSTNFSNFGPLIGVVYVNNTHCRFLIYSTKNAEVLTFHELKLRQIIHNAGWLEYDAAEIWRMVQECIEVAHKNLVILEISPHDIVTVGICNQRGTTVLWDKTTGVPLHNAIGWIDCRSAGDLKNVLSKFKKDTNHFRNRTGLPLSTCFSVFKIRWLQENVPSVTLAINDESCLFGTLDSWILWNLTGGVDCGIHSTDVTNAGYTLLMNVRSLQWDRKLCRFFNIPMHILPKIRSNSELFGHIVGGALSTVPITGSIADQPAALLGQLSIKVGHNSCSIDDSCCVMLNTGRELIESDNGLLSIIAYKLGPQQPTCYALEGAISNAGSTISWLKDKLLINTEINSNDNAAEVLTSFLGENSMMSSYCSSGILNNECGLAAKRSEITLVPAFYGLYAPYWRYDARGIILGLTNQTTSENIAQAAYEATGFQIYEVLQAFKRDTAKWDRSKMKMRLVINGDYVENTTFMQLIADIVGCALERPQTTSPSALGAMIAAGVTINVVSLVQADLMYAPPADILSPTTTPNRRELLYKRWEYAVKKCLSWNNYETFESDLALFAQRERDPYLSLRRSIPGSIFVTSTFVLLIVAKLLKNKI